MKKLALTTLLLVAPLFALASGAGFSQGLWVSDATPVLGEEISIFALVSNSSSSRISGTVVFFDGSTQIGTAAFGAGGNGGYDIVRTTFTVSTGVHHLHAELHGVSGGSADAITSSELSIAATDEGRPQGSVEGVISATTGSLNDLLTKGTKYAQKYAPGLVEGASTTYERIDAFRAVEADALHTKAESVYKEAAAESKGARIGPTASTSKSTSYETVGKQFEYLALSALSYVFSHRLWFYLVALVLLWWLLRSALRVIRRLISGRPE